MSNKSQLDLRTILLGLLAFLALTVLTSLLLAALLPAMYSSLAMSGHFSPQYIVYLVVLAVIQFGVPAYLTAAIAKTSKVVQSFIVGLVGTLVVIGVSWPGPRENPLLALGTAVFAILVATLAGKLRDLRGS
jgi:hypothetical protein